MTGDGWPMAGGHFSVCFNHLRSITALSAIRHPPTAILFPIRKQSRIFLVIFTSALTSPGRR